MSETVCIVEVGPRDGLQNEKTPVSVADRIAVIEALIGAGLHTIEVGAFVSPKAIPQMVNSDQVLRGVSHHPDAEFHVLVPNEKGYVPHREASPHAYRSLYLRPFQCVCHPGAPFVAGSCLELFDDVR
jgi:hydroxymethylglutaryl-CoA lyase